MISRRSLLVAVAGVPVGAMIGASAHIANHPVPSIRVIGNRTGLLVIIETGTERLLMLAGEIEERLWSQRSQLITLGREHLDAIIATYTNLIALSINGQTMGTTAILSLQRNASLPPVRGAVIPVADNVEMQLGESALLTIEIFAAIEGDGRPDFLITFVCEGTTSIIASGSSVARRTAQPSVDALIVPGEVTSEDIAGLRPSLLVSGTDDRIPGSHDHILVFTESTAELVLKNGAIHVDANQLLP